MTAPMPRSDSTSDADLHIWANSSRMTGLVSVKINDGVVMAADSASSSYTLRDVAIRLRSFLFEEKVKAYSGSVWTRVRICGYIPAQRPGAKSSPEQTQEIIYANAGLLNYLVGAGEQRRWHFEAERSRRLKIDDEFILGRRLQLCLWIPGTRARIAGWRRCPRRPPPHTGLTHCSKRSTGLAYSITSSAVASNLSGMVSPSALDVPVC
jgi:hypothetical protein